MTEQDDNVIGAEFVVTGLENSEQRLEQFQRSVEQTARVVGQAGQSDVFGENYARQTIQAQRATLQLQQSFRQLKAPNLGAEFARETEQARHAADALQQRLAILYSQANRPLSGRALDEYVAGIKHAEAELQKLEQQQLQLQVRQVQAGGRGRGRFAGDIGEGIVGGLGIPIGTAAVVTAGIGVFVAGVGKAVEAVTEATDANRTLSASATEAGLSYEATAEQAERFGERVALANTEAARTFSDLVRLAGQAGRTQELDLIEKRFSDLAAARGIAAKDLSTITQQIITGQDEGLNRLGLPDPSRLYDAYAKSLGTTADALTETEKAQARLSAVMDKGALFSGAAEERLHSVSGQVDQFNASVGNLATGIGSAMTQNQEFHDLLWTINDALKAISFSADEVRQKLKEGLSPEQIAAGQTEGTGTRIWGAVKGGLTSLPASAAYLYDLAAGESREDASRRLNEALTGGNNRRRGELTERIRNEQRQMERQEQQAREQAAANERRRAEEAAKLAAQREASAIIVSAQSQLGREENLQERLDGILHLKDGIEEFGKTGALSAEQVSDKLRALDEQLYQTQQQIEQTIRHTRNEVQGFLQDVGERATQNNPFTRLYNQIETASERAQARFGAFGRDFAEQMAEIERQSLRAELATARFYSQLSAIRDRQEADRLDRGIVGLSGPDQRELEVFQARTAAATQGLSGQVMSEALRAGFTKVDPGYLARRQFDELQKLQEQLRGLSPGARDAAQGLVDQQLKSLFDSLDDRTKQQVVSRPAFREVFAGAFERDNVRAQAEIRRAAERQEASNQIRRNVEEQLQLLRAGNLSPDAEIKAFLDISGTLPDNELTGDLRRGRAEAFRERARREEEKDRDGKEAITYIKSVMAKLDSLITARGIKVDAPASNVNLNLSDGLAVDKALLGTTPSSDDAEVPPVGFAPGFRY